MRRGNIAEMDGNRLSDGEGTDSKTPHPFGFPFSIAEKIMPIKFQPGIGKVISLYFYPPPPPVRTAPTRGNIDLHGNTCVIAT